jgi:hypothetical protein
MLRLGSLGRHPGGARLRRAIQEERWATNIRSVWGGVFVDRITATRGGKRLDVGLLLHVTIRDGRIVDGVDHFHPEHAWDAFWE